MTLQYDLLSTGGRHAECMRVHTATQVLLIVRRNSTLSLSRACRHTIRHTVRRCLRQVTMRAETTAAITKVDEAYKTFTNPEGYVILPVVKDVWAADRPFTWNTIDVGGRMAVLRLSDGSIWVHSPVPLDAKLKEALAALGPVRHVVSPNYEHVAYAKQWQDAYPEAKLYACPGLPAKKPDVRFDVVLSNGASPPEWNGEVEACFLGHEANPFTGKPFFNEVVFLHKPSGMLITADLFWNYPARGTTIRTQIWKQGMDRVYRPFYNTFMIKRPEQYKVAMQRVFDEWDWDAVLPCHGEIILSGAKEQVRAHLAL